MAVAVLDRRPFGRGTSTARRRRRHRDSSPTTGRAAPSVDRARVARWGGVAVDVRLSCCWSDERSSSAVAAITKTPRPAQQRRRPPRLSSSEPTISAGPHAIVAPHDRQDEPGADAALQWRRRAGARVGLARDAATRTAASTIRDPPERRASAMAYHRVPDRPAARRDALVLSLALAAHKGVATRSSRRACCVAPRSVGDGAGRRCVPACANGLRSPHALGHAPETIARRWRRPADGACEDRRYRDHRGAPESVELGQRRRAVGEDRDRPAVRMRLADLPRARTAKRAGPRATAGPRQRGASCSPPSRRGSTFSHGRERRAFDRGDEGHARARAEARRRASVSPPRSRRASRWPRARSPTSTWTRRTIGWRWRVSPSAGASRAARACGSSSCPRATRDSSSSCPATRVGPVGAAPARGALGPTLSHPRRWSTSSPSGRAALRWCRWPRCGRDARACWSATRAGPSPRSCSTPCRC